MIWLLLGVVLVLLLVRRRFVGARRSRSLPGGGERL